MTEIVVRRGGLKDIDQIVKVHSSDLENDLWYAFPNGQRVETKDPENLSLYERWLNGGSWMSNELCTIYINSLLLGGHIPIVAEIDGMVVGELELFFGWESDHKLYAHIGVLQVHKDFQRQGIGTKLLQKAISTAKKRGASYLSVRPRDLLQPFYQEYGFSEWLKTVVFEAQAGPYLAKLRWEEDNTVFNKMKFWDFILGQEQSSAQIWQIFNRNFFALPEFTREPIHTGVITSDTQETVAIFFPHVYFGDMANVYAWSKTQAKDEHLWSILTLAYHFGYDRVRSLLDTKQFEKLSAKLPLVEIERQEIFRLDLKKRDEYEMADFV